MHAPILGSRDLHWPDEGATAEAAQQLAARLQDRSAVIELRGPLGAGKTTFARHLLRALGVAGRIKSPSYAIAESHEAGGQVLWHFDFYRFSSPQEWEDAGFRDIFAGPGLKLVEWPEQAEAWLPVPDLRLSLVPEPGTEARQARFEALTPFGLTLLP